MKQGEIWYADLNPTRGSAQSGFRPLVIISGNLLNDNLNVVITCPLTTSVKGYKGNIVLDPNPKNKLTQTLEVLVFHIRSVAKDRLVRKIGRVDSNELKKIIIGLNEMLRY